MSFNRIAAFAGFTFVALAITNGVLLGSPPFPDADVTEVRAYVERDEGLHKAALLALIIALPFSVVFFAGIVERIRQSDRRHGEAWGIATFGGVILAGAAAIVGDTLYALLVYRGGVGLDDQTLGLLKDGELIAYSAMGIALATIAGCVAVPTFTHRVLPRWHGALGVFVAILGIVGTLAMVSDTDTGGWLSAIATLSLGVWVLATSFVLLQALPGEATPPPPAPA